MATHGLLRLSPSVLLSTTTDSYVAYDVRRERLFRLNPTAALIVELCDGTRDLPGLQADFVPLVPLFGADWQGCLDWIESAIRDRIIDDTPPDPTADAPPTAVELSAQADSLQHRDRVLAAFVCQRRAAELAPDDPDMWLRLGELAHIIGQRNEARSAYQRYLSQCPDDAEIAHLLTALADTAPPPRVSDRCIEQLYSRFATFYDENMTGELDYCAPDKLHEATVTALGHRAGLDVLDLGCGTGLGGALWRARAAHLVGVDLSAEMIARARTRAIYDRLETAEITQWLAQTTSDLFDLVLACDTLIYFGDLALVVEPAATKLRPGGLLGFTVERGDTDPFRLSDSGRFTHHPNHVSSVAANTGLTLLSLDETTVRYEYGEPVAGLSAVCQG
jgi:predicted TPR repeat methyltransferase